jgi:hypothetical protein
MRGFVKRQSLQTTQQNSGNVRYSRAVIIARLLIG